MKKVSDSDVARLKKLLYQEYYHIPNNAFEILKDDLSTLLRSYFDLTEDPINFSVESCDEGILTIAFSARATAIKEVKIL